jgi:hypothetical protein
MWLGMLIVIVGLNAFIVLVLRRIGRARTSAARHSMQEPWNFDLFEQAYNAIASRDTGYRFEKTAASVRDAEEGYRDGRFATIQEYAETRFVLDQLT